MHQRRQHCAIMPLTNFGSVAYTSASYNSGTAYASSNTTPIELSRVAGSGTPWGHWEQAAHSR